MNAFSAVLIVSAMTMLASSSALTYPQSSLLIPGQSLPDGEARWSPNLQYRMEMWNGDLFLEQWSSDLKNPNGSYIMTVWSICSLGKGVGGDLTLNPDGTLELRDANQTVLWTHSCNVNGTADAPYFAMVTDGGDLVEYKGNGTDVVWTSADVSTQNPIAGSVAKFQYGDCTLSK
uniref:Bulb-type lectin domain-containing protein n=1 Tax=Spongospora subterranea TaxID=70186 RepID=A0A0H5RD16_9EUKA|eukprot:CRZ11492.1 hypothetical protein [Spongospora subterranea]